MSKTAREVIENFLDPAWPDDSKLQTERLFTALDAAGFVIVPKEKLDRLIGTIDAYDEQCHLAVIDGKIWSDVTAARDSFPQEPKP